MTTFLSGRHTLDLSDGEMARVVEEIGRSTIVGLEVRFPDLKRAIAKCITVEVNEVKAEQHSTKAWVHVDCYYSSKDFKVEDVYDLDCYDQIKEWFGNEVCEFLINGM